MISEWFQNNYMKLNGDKCHLMIFFGEKTDDLSIKIGNTTIIESREEKLLGATVDKQLSFKTQVQSLYKKQAKSFTLFRVFPTYLTKNTSISCELLSCPSLATAPLWIFCDRHLDNKINHIHKKALSIAYKDNVSDFDALLTTDNSVSMAEIYKTVQIVPQA